MLATIKTLTELYGPVGREERVAAYLKERWSPRVEDLRVTPVGNVMARVGGSGPALAITAHMDEICLFVKSITPDGFGRVTHCHRGSGSYHIRDGLGWEFEVLTHDGHLVPAVLASRTGHLRFSHSQQSASVDLEHVFLDFGLSSRQAVEEAGVTVGAPAVWKTPTRQLGEHIVGKAMDDRIGLAIMTHLLETLKPEELQCELYLVATVMEEMGLVGAASVPSQLPQLDMCVALEIGVCGDIPTVDEDEAPVRMGQGPIIRSKDGTTHYTHAMTERLIQAAKRGGIAFQRSIAGGGTDGLEFLRAGVATGLMAPPTRYTHSPIEMVHPGDVLGCVELLRGLVTGDLS